VRYSLHVGDRVTYGGRRFVVRGFTPLSVEPRCLHLEDAETGEQVDALADEVEAGMASSAAKSVG
jgi:hypothetical protein